MVGALAVGAAAGGLSALGTIGQGLINRSATEKQNKIIQEAINQIRANAERQYNGLYGGNATYDSMSTGNAYQDYLLKMLAQNVQAKEIAAANLEAGKALRTDEDAKRQLYQLLVQQNTANTGAQLGNAWLNARKAGIGNAGNLLWQASKQNAANNQTAWNQSRLATADNLSQLSKASLNTGSVADQNRQQVQGMYNQANSNYNNAVSAIAGLTTQKQPVQGFGTMLGQGLMSGVANGLSTGLQYGAYNTAMDKIDSWVNKLAAARGGSNG